MFCPPHPKPLSPLGGLVRTALSGEGNLLSLLPKNAYRDKVGPLGYSRRGIYVVNDPALARDIMLDPADIYPKNDLMVGALEPLVGDSLFVSSGDTWRQQRRMIDPAFTLMRINRAFASMAAAVDDYEQRLKELAQKQEPFSLDQAMSHLTADIITRTVFSVPLKSQTALEVFNAFSYFERSVAHVELKRLIFDKPWSHVPHHAEVLDACERIRELLGELLDTHLEESGKDYNDIASAVIGAEDPQSGKRFTREELIDQLGVFFLAGHETTASVLTWVFYIVSILPEVLARMRAEVDEIVGNGPVEFEHTKKLTFNRNVFRETLRLYPPITFMPRVAAEPGKIGKYKIKKGAMIMLSPWTMHRNAGLWENPNAFDPDRFSSEREAKIPKGAYIPFGQGPRVCIGAAFATVESALILARLLRSFDFHVENPDKVRPVARLTTRPAEQIICRVTERDA